MHLLFSTQSGLEVLEPVPIKRSRQLNASWKRSPSQDRNQTTRRIIQPANHCANELLLDLFKCLSCTNHQFLFDLHIIGIWITHLFTIPIEYTHSESSPGITRRYVTPVRVLLFVNWFSLHHVIQGYTIISVFIMSDATLTLTIILFCKINPLVRLFPTER